MVYNYGGWITIEIKTISNNAPPSSKAFSLSFQWASSIPYSCL